ncbi:MAG: SpoVG family protein, partial [Ruminococcus sp.]|nr:SpoVG family protein [Ruminococcus sp.]
MPSHKDENGIFRDIVHPISPASRKLFEECILEAYDKQIAMLEAEEAEKSAEEATEA